MILKLEYLFKTSSYVKPLRLPDLKDFLKPKYHFQLGLLTQKIIKKKQIHNMDLKYKETFWNLVFL